jgi:uncharacterized membrane protein
MDPVLRRLFAVAAVSWAIALPAAAWLASHHELPQLAYALGVGVYGIGSWICHQRPARSFQMWAVQMPVCARCAGIYAGGAIGAIVASFAGLKPRATTAPRGISARQILIASAIPTMLTLVFEWTTGVAPSNWIRAAAGLPLGVAIAWVVARAEVN